MEVIADLHIHSRHARATSKDISIENLEKYACIKGLHLLGTGDFQHPLWRKEINEKLREDSGGILRTKSGFPFLWQTEISFMFSQGGKRRAIHLLIFAPNTALADKITSYLGSKGRLDYDGRPIFGISCMQVVHDLKAIDDRIEIIPAHAFTPWFGLYGSDSGFDSIQDCFGSESKHIYAIESGMSADPVMIWRLKEKINIVSFSDAHSFWPWRLGREATIFDIPTLSYSNILGAIRSGNGIRATIETPPEYGKYHWDGHRNCNFSCSPQESLKRGKKCPVCGGNLTIGVEFRIEQLAKEKQGFKPENAKLYYSLAPLQELISFVQGGALSTKKTWETYNKMIENWGNEIAILLRVKREDLLENGVDGRLVDLIILGREGKLRVKPGYDGAYGVIKTGEVKERKEERISENEEGHLKKKAVKIHYEKQAKLF